MTATHVKVSVFPIHVYLYNYLIYIALKTTYMYLNLLPTGSEERGVLGVGSILVFLLSKYENYCISIA